MKQLFRGIMRMTFLALLLLTFGAQAEPFIQNGLIYGISKTPIKFSPNISGTIISVTNDGPGSLMSVLRTDGTVEYVTFVESGGIFWNSFCFGTPGDSCSQFHAGDQVEMEAVNILCEFDGQSCGEKLGTQQHPIFGAYIEYTGTFRPQLTNFGLGCDEDQCIFLVATNLTEGTGSVSFYSPGGSLIGTLYPAQLAFAPGVVTFYIPSFVYGYAVANNDGQIGISVTNASGFASNIQLMNIYP